MVHSVRRLLPILLVPWLVDAKTLTAKIKTPINNTLEYGVATECKTCPYSLCTNKAYYDYGTTVTLLCWTVGTQIDNDTTWLETSDGCYVTQDDLMAYNGTYETDLSYCGEDSEEENLTFDTTVVQYDSECNICPDNLDCATVMYLSPDTEIIVTCWTDAGAAVIGDTTWLKTTDNCYVNEQGLRDPANKDILDNCGPIGFLQLNDTGSRKRESLPDRDPAPDLSSPPGTGIDLGSQYLVNLTVGEDYAYCYNCPNTTTCDVVTRYRFKQEVWMQCYYTAPVEVANETYWYETTDFCYVREVDFFQSLFDQYRFPDCSLFDQDTTTTSR
ncbi:uncharacterized protein LY89DRAFT_741715 [Mollisia scopiformis]|uniref:Uncharacterized protein n=1 Tax=Mollisia scopiformis TaxID=149040 RepID=A0A132B910_MOLSC|nr:uncharacterized protein LY89DRAFT_741715 [Mollisia scopiformis]KUJ08886.1 hypothetical protein LY89DRAFT_741715 [Mollisia scopiformis]